MAAASLMDLDGLTIIGGQSFYQTYHKLLCHNLMFSIVIATTLAAFSRGASVCASSACSGFTSCWRTRTS